MRGIARISALALGCMLVVELGLTSPALLGCRARSNDKKTRERVHQEIAQHDQYYRDRAALRDDDLAIIEKYLGWFEPIRAIDHAARGLPPPEELPDGTIRQATESEVFCDQVAAMHEGDARPSPAEWTAAFREQAARWTVASPPWDGEQFRDLYLAERQLAKLACIARDGGPALRGALLAPLDAPVVKAFPEDDIHPPLEPGFGQDVTVAMVDETVQYVAAIFAIVHELDPAKGERMLRAMGQGDNRMFGAEARGFIKGHLRPFSLNPYRDTEYEMARQSLGPDYKGPRKMRTGTIRRVLP